MKRTLTAALALMLVLTLGFALVGCGGGNAVQNLADELNAATPDALGVTYSADGNMLIMTTVMEGLDEETAQAALDMLDEMGEGMLELHRTAVSQVEAFRMEYADEDGTVLAYVVFR